MPETQRSLPKWILIVSALIALLEIMVSIMLYVAPEMVVKTGDLDAESVPYLTAMWAVRQFALGFIFAFATWKRSIPMLTIAYIFFLVMMAGDLIVGILQKENSMITAALVMCIFSSAMLFAINRRK